MPVLAVRSPPVRRAIRLEVITDPRHLPGGAALNHHPVEHAGDPVLVKHDLERTLAPDFRRAGRVREDLRTPARSDTRALGDHRLGLPAPRRAAAHVALSAGFHTPQLRTKRAL